MPSNPSTLVSFDEHHSPEYGAEPVIDRDAFAVLASLADEDDPGLVEELLALFLDDSSARIQSILDGRSGDALEAIGAAAHSLKSSSANIGALAFSSTCARLEAAAREREPGSDLPGLIAQVEAMYGDLRRALQPGA